MGTAQRDEGSALIPGRWTGGPTSGLLLAFALGLVGCASPGDPVASDLRETADGLSQLEIERPGTLFGHEDHRIGGYDAFMVEESSVAYERRSKRFSPALEAMFLATLEQSLLDAAEGMGVPVVDAPGACVLQVAAELVNVSLAPSSRTEIGKLSIVMEMRDSESGDPLLRYVRHEQIDDDGSGAPRVEQLQRGVDAMVEGLQVARAARLAAGPRDESLPSCGGRIAQQLAEPLPSVSAR